ncbi:hypothetical protein CURE108131_24620 [Cupriavidus respiraculi]|uniref:Uncharacterized protein n=1 Tax=Cupriavidus respiraculi TaxID=195930 RepID=A0ABN7YMT9_9BURK|nr:hypothetical protein [Cupriavidus respiraculi]CAG9173736.1 hypothetical protein LMG21510_02343 [Cupriavidus respiraculi]
MPAISAAAPRRSPWMPDSGHDVPLPHRPGCGFAPASESVVAVVAGRLRSALDTADALGLGPADPIDLHVCELRQLARWGIVAGAQDIRPYFQRWTIDDADPVFPVAVAELRGMLARLDALHPMEDRSGAIAPPPLGRTFC